MQLKPSVNSDRIIIVLDRIILKKKKKHKKDKE